MMCVTVHDRFEIRPNMAGIDHPPGLIVVYRPATDAAGREPEVGTTVRISTPGSGELYGRVDVVKEHGPARSLFLPGLTAAAVPVGSTVEWEVAAVPASA